MNILFSPPDITEEEIQAVSEALRSGWITTGPRTKSEEFICSYKYEIKESNVRYEKSNLSFERWNQVPWQIFWI